MQERPRTIFFGTTNTLSLAALETLLDGAVTPRAIVVTVESAGLATVAPLTRLHPAEPVSELPLLTRYHEPTLIQAAWTADIPLYAWGKGGQQAVHDLMLSLRPEVACVACFPRRLPPQLLAMPAQGFLNVHPSLLPHYRGPAPLFWLFQKHDLDHRGVTVHRMDEGLDSGPVVRQEPLRFADGLGQSSIERQCGQLGGRLLMETMALLSSGHRSRPQSGPGSYHPWPVAADYELQANWPAIRAFNFMRATNGSQLHYPLNLSGRRFVLAEALSVDVYGRQRSKILREGPIAHFQFDPGILTARLAPD